jgi:DdrB-like protein
MTETTKSQLLLYLKAIAATHPPNWQYSLKAYIGFNWGKIGATIISEDRHGATQVAWCGHIYTRRAGENKKFGAAIWFSRPNGKGEGDEATYAKLITFKRAAAQAEPLPDYVVQALKGN